MPPTSSSLLASRLDWLFQRLLKPDGTAWSHPEIARVTEQLERENPDQYRSVTAGAIWKIRYGRVDNPGIKTMAALASAFGVPTNYFTADEDTLQSTQDIQVLDNPAIREISYRAARLDEATLASIQALLRQITKDA